MGVAISELTVDDVIDGMRRDIVPCKGVHVENWCWRRTLEVGNGKLSSGGSGII